MAFQINNNNNRFFFIIVPLESILFTYSKLNWIIVLNLNFKPAKYNKPSPPLHYDFTYTHKKSLCTYHVSQQQQQQ